MQGCHSPPPPPTPWYPPLPVKWVVVLFGLVAFPVWSFLASSPPCGVFYRGSTELWYGCKLRVKLHAAAGGRGGLDVCVGFAFEFGLRLSSVLVVRHG